jgi:serine/threonine protein kinase
MPFVACESLQQRLDRQGPLEVKEILRIGMQAAAALAAAHAQGLVHRDVKPANILLEKGIDRVVLTDFGLARAADDGSLTRTGIVAGTPQYMSPEQAQGDSLDSRSDLFSLGSVLYAMATGWPPFRAETTLGVLRRISDTQPRSLREVNPEIPAWLEQVILKLHGKTPCERFQTAGEVADLLEQCLAHVQQPKVAPLPKNLLLQDAPSRFGWWDIVAVSTSALFALVLWVVFVVSIFRDGLWQAETSVRPGDPSDQQISRDARQFDSDLGNLEQRTSQPWDSPPKQNGNLP